MDGDSSFALNLNLSVTGFPLPTVSCYKTGSPASLCGSGGVLPAGVVYTFNPATGAGSLSGWAHAGTAGAYDITVAASSPGKATALQNYVIDVDKPPAITSLASATFTVGTHGSFTVTTTGFPIPALTKSGTLPSGVTFKDNGDGTATISGTPGAGTGGSYIIQITANNGVNPSASQSFTLKVNQPPKITSAASRTFTVGAHGSFTVTTTGFPASGAHGERGTAVGCYLHRQRERYCHHLGNPGGRDRRVPTSSRSRPITG